jgi:hypothetical protein
VRLGGLISPDLAEESTSQSRWSCISLRISMTVWRENSFHSFDQSILSRFLRKDSNLNWLLPTGIFGIQSRDILAGLTEECCPQDSNVEQVRADFGHSNQ